jgi:hypothetical protein
MADDYVIGPARRTVWQGEIWLGEDAVRVPAVDCPRRHVIAHSKISLAVVPDAVFYCLVHVSYVLHSILEDVGQDGEEVFPGPEAVFSGKYPGLEAVFSGKN